VRADGSFVCLTTEWKVVCDKLRQSNQYGLGRFLLADDLFYVFADTGKLRIIQADTTEFKLLSQAKYYLCK
jgi:hypothetical protein